MHDEIVRFERSGFTQNNATNREWQIRDVEVEMRDNGFVPSIDNEPQYTVEFSREHEGFFFVLSVYGMEVGEDAWDVSGVTNGKMIMRPTPPHRSKES